VKDLKIFLYKVFLSLSQGEIKTKTQTQEGGENAFIV
jgi:hypothetical protein